MTDAKEGDDRSTEPDAENRSATSDATAAESPRDGEENEGTETKASQKTSTATKSDKKDKSQKDGYPSDFDPEHPERFEEGQPTDRGVLIGMGGRWLSDWALRLAIGLVALWLLGQILGFVWVGILPVLLALIVSTVVWPPVKYMKKIGIPAALAALLSIILGLGLIAGIIALITPSIVNQAPQLVDSASIGIRRLQDWIQGPPLNINDDQINDGINQAVGFLQERGEDIAGGVFAGVSTLGSVVVTLLLVLVLTFFFVKDGPRFLPWLRGVTGRRAGRHLTEVLTRAWVTLGGFIRTQAIVSFVDAFFIGIGLVILGVPLAWALAVLTFLGGFIPIVGAFTAGALAVLVAFVSNGLTTAIIVLVLVIAVQQLEGNVLQPVLQSRSMNLHPVVILLAVAGGGTLFGILGAFLAVPVAAVVAVIIRYVSEQIDLMAGDVSASDVKPATEEGRLTAWLAEVSSVRFRDLPGVSSLVPPKNDAAEVSANKTEDVRKAAQNTDLPQPADKGGHLGIPEDEESSSSGSGKGSSEKSGGRAMDAVRRLIRRNE